MKRVQSKHPSSTERRVGGIEDRASRIKHHLLITHYLLFVTLSSLIAPLPCIHSQELDSLEAGRGTLAFIRLAEQVTASVYEDFQGRVSPDGLRLVFVSERSGNLDIWLRSLDFNNVTPDRQLTTATAVDTMPSWSPNGKSIVYVSNSEDTRGDIWILSLKNGKPIKLTDRRTADSGPRWSPGGRTLVYASQSPGKPERLYTYDLKSRKRSLLTTMQARNPAISPDGKWVVFDSTENDPTGNLWLVSISGGIPTQLTEGPTYDITPTFSTDGKSILFTRFIDDTNSDGHLDTSDNPSIWRLPLPSTPTLPNSQTPIQLTSSSHYSVFPESHGKHVYYTSNERNGLNIWKLPLEGLLLTDKDPEIQYLIAQRLEENQPPDWPLALLAWRRFLHDAAPRSGDRAVTPFIVEARFRMAGVYRHLNNHAESNATLRGLLDDYKASPPAGDSRKFIGLAELELERNKFEQSAKSTTKDSELRAKLPQSIESIQKIRKRYSDEEAIGAAAAILRGELWLYIHGDIRAQNKALAAFDEVKRDFPDLEDQCAEALYRRASIYEKLGESQQLVNAYLKVLNDYPFSKEWCTRASEQIIKKVASIEGTADERIQKLRDLIEKHADLPALPAMAQLRIGDTFYDMTETAKAKQAFKVVVEEYSHETEFMARASFALARIYYEEENYEKTLETYSQIQEEFRTGNEMFYRLARQRFIQRKLEKAERDLRVFNEPRVALKTYMQLVKFDDEIVEAHRGVVAVSELLDRIHQARAKKQRRSFKAAGLQAQFPNLLQTLGKYQQRMDKEQDAASSEYKYVAAYVVGLIYTYFEPTTYLDTAISYLQQSATLNSQMSFAHQTLGFCYEQKAYMGEKGMRLKEPSKEWFYRALDEYLIALSLNDESFNEQAEVALLVNIGNGFMQLGDARQAFLYYSKAWLHQEKYAKDKKSPFDNDDRSLAFLERFGQAAFKADDLEASTLSLKRAEALARKFLEGDLKEDQRQQGLPILSRILDRLALAYQTEGQYAEAAEKFIEVSRINSELGNDSNRLKAVRNAALNIYRTSQASESEHEESLVLALQNLEDGLGNLDTYAKQKQGTQGEGLINIQQDVALSEDVQAARGFDRTGEERLLYTYIGKIYRESLDYSKAIDAYQRKLKLYANNAEPGNLTARAIIQNQLGYFHYKLGHPDEAISSFNESLGIAEQLQSWPGVVLNATNLGRMACERLADGNLQIAELNSAVKAMQNALDVIRREKLETHYEFRIHLCNQLGVLYHRVAQSASSTGEKDLSKRVASVMKTIQLAGSSFTWFEKALGFLREATTKTVETRRAEASLYINMGQVSELAGDTESALRHYESAWNLADGFMLYEFQWKAKFRQGLLLPESVQLDYFVEAIDLLELAPPLDPFPSGDHNLADKLYRYAVRGFLKSGDQAEALNYAERAQEQAYASQTGSRYYDFEDEEYREAFNALRESLEKLKNLRGELAEMDMSDNENSRYGRLRARYMRTLERYKEDLSFVTEDLPELASLFRVGATPAEEIQQLLTGASAYVRYVPVGDELNIWVVTSEKLIHRKIEMDKSLMKRLRPETKLSQADTDRLSEILVDPIKDILKTKKRLYIAPNPELAEVPWHRLKVENKRLNEAAELSFLTGTNHYFFAHFKQSPHKKSLLITGRPERSHSQPAGIEDLQIDAEDVRQNPFGVLSKLNRYHAVELGQPIQINGNVLNTSVLQGKGLRKFSQVKAAQAIEQGQAYSMTEYNKDLNNGLLTLTDLRTKEGFGGRASVAALTRAFTFAGFPTVVVHVPGSKAEPEAVAEFLDYFYEKWKKNAAGEALRLAQEEAAKTGMSEEFWSRFRLFGHLGLTETEAKEFATIHFERSFHVAKEAKTSGDWERAIRYYENALSLVEILGREKLLPFIYQELSISGFNGRQFGKAVYYGRKKVQILKANPDKAYLAQALFDLGIIYNEAEQYRNSIETLHEAVKLFESLGNREKIFSALGQLGNVQQFAGQYQTALTTLLESIQFGEELGNEVGIAKQYRLIGAIYYRRLSDNENAEEFYERALEIFNKQYEETGAEKDLKQVTRLTLDLGLLHERRADFPKALETYDVALEMARAAKDLVLQSEAITNKANTHWFQGSYQNAFLFQREALELARTAKSRFREEVILNTLGLIYWTLNDYERALENLEEALKICESLSGSNGKIEIASTHNNIGLIYRAQHNYKKALVHFNKALEIDLELKSEWGIAYDERNIGMTYIRMGKLQEALASLQSAAKRCRKIGDTTNLVKSLYSLGNAHRKLGKPDEANSSYSEALKVSTSANIQEIIWRSEQGLGKVALAQGNRPQAIEHFKTAIELVERMRAAIKIEEFKNGFVTNKLDLYEDMILLLLDENRNADAFSYSERSRSRNFIDLLENRNLDLGNPAANETRKKQADLRRELDVLARKASKAEGDEKVKAAEELRTIQRAYEDLLIDIKLKNPELSSFISVQPLSVQDVQALLEPGVVLLEYMVAKDEVITWIVNRNSLEVARTPIKQPDLRQKIQKYRKLMQSVKDFKDESAELYDILYRPVVERVKDAKRIGLIPHDYLHYLSFACLYDGENYLIDNSPLFYVPSASVLSYSFKRRQRKKNPKVLAIGNPDLRNEALELPFAEREVESIKWPFPQVDILKGDSATEQTFVKSSAEYGIIHIASHGEFDAVNPLFSRILLARDREEDGNLEVEEIFKLTLNADLVVLSACQSGLGKLQKGDEMIGLSRAFTYAGTHSLLSTLWRVSDVTTAILVKHFYRNYFDEDKAASLRKAQLLVKRYYPHPSYWAGFVLSGDYK
jgi:CHAT domain-containing protein/Tol biopolymer transport system component/predicted negative regulator of RcsB-dependent stress response